MFVITNPDNVTNEFTIISKLFQEGLPLLHIRKPHFTMAEMQHYINQIPVEFHSKLVLHQHHVLADTFDINRIHLKEQNRFLFTPDRCSKTIRHYSTSVHSIEAFNNLPESYQYAFLSPVFESLSKPGYRSEADLLKSPENRMNHTTQLIALGGIDPSNIRSVLQSGFDGIALLGTIWKSNDPILSFRKCRDQSNTIKNLK